MENNEQESWHRNVVSWGQFALAILVVAGSIFSVLTLWERRVTVLEERQAFVLRTLAQDQSELALLRSTISNKLDSIQSQLTQITLELTKHQAISEALDEMGPGGVGKVRIPKSRQ
jgi:hypothetical protein